MNPRDLNPKTALGQRFRALVAPFRPMLASAAQSGDPSGIAADARRVFSFFMEQRDHHLNNAEVVDVDDVLLELWPSWDKRPTGLARTVLDLLALSEDRLMRSGSFDGTRNLKRFFTTWKEQEIDAKTSE